MTNLNEFEQALKELAKASEAQFDAIYRAAKAETESSGKSFLVEFFDEPDGVEFNEADYVSSDLMAYIEGAAKEFAQTGKLIDNVAS